jgi:lysyl-tRNA synthetase class I
MSMRLVRTVTIALSPEEKHQQFALGEAVLRKALMLQSDSPDYSPALPYRALASLYSHVNDFHSALAFLKNAQQADPTSATSPKLDSEIQGIERYLSSQNMDH